MRLKLRALLEEICGYNYKHQLEIYFNLHITWSSLVKAAVVYGLHNYNVWFIFIRNHLCDKTNGVLIKQNDDKNYSLFFENTSFTVIAKLRSKVIVTGYKT